MNVYRSSPLLPGIPLPFHLLPSTHLQLEPDPKDSPDMEDYIDSSDNEFGCVEAGDLAVEEGGRERSPSPSESARADVLKGPCSAARKCRGSSHPDDNR